MIVQGNSPYSQPSFSLSNRLLRAIWELFWCIFFRLSPRPLHAWRSFLLRMFGAKIGRNVHIYPSVRVWAPWNLCIADNVGVGDRSILYSMALIKVAEYSVISQGSHLCAGTHDIESSNFQLVASPISIGSHVWLCTETFVAPGVSIADGCVVGARGVVTKSIGDEWTVWAGVPVKKIRHRNRCKVISLSD